MFGRSTADEERLVADAMRQLGNRRVDRPLPDPSFIWWKAQRLRRLEAEREATTPIDIGERVHLGVAILGALALAAGTWDQLPSLAFTPSSGLAVALAAVVLLSLIALAALDATRQG
jgi:hypothetical protein